MTSFKIGTIIVVNDKMQSNYQYKLEAPIGQHFDPDFQPQLTPKEMLQLGVFEGKYCNDCQAEFPASWFKDAKLAEQPDVSKNRFRLKSRQPLSVWRANGWIKGDDPRGWFQWYMRYYLGRRDQIIDRIQIKRWRSFARHVGQIRANCAPGDLSCRPRQRQAILQWAYNPFI